MSTHSTTNFPYSYLIEWYSPIMPQTGREILKIKNQIHKWLEENINQDSSYNYRWDHYNPAKAFYTGIMELEFLPNILRFRFREDLLAFTLRFNIPGQNLL
jgi:hypothetical protein